MSKGGADKTRGVCVATQRHWIMFPAYQLGNRFLVLLSLSFARLLMQTIGRLRIHYTPNWIIWEFTQNWMIWEIATLTITLKHLHFNYSKILCVSIIIIIWKQTQFSLSKDKITRERSNRYTECQQILQRILFTLQVKKKKLEKYIFAKDKGRVLRKVTSYKHFSNLIKKLKSSLKYFW